MADAYNRHLFRVHRPVTPARRTAGPGLATSSRIAEELGALGLRRGDIVCLHASQSALGVVIGGARAVIEGVIEAVGGDMGTLMMPSYSGDLSDPAEWRHPEFPTTCFDTIRAETPAYDAERTPTRGMGVVAEYFRTYPGARRSEHPQSSFTALGNHAVELLRPHPLDYRFGPNSPLGRLVSLDGVVLLLGAPHDTVSLFHLTQHLVGWVTPVHKKSPIIRDGEKVWVSYDDVLYPIDWFHDAVGMLIHEGIARSGLVCDAPTVLLPAARSVERVICWRREHGR